VLKIRLRRVGKKKQPSYRVVVADARSPRDGRFVESIGHYNPRTEPATITVQEDRALYWLSQGAQPTGAVERILRNMGTFDKLKQLRAGATIEELVVTELEAEVAEPEPEAVEAAVPEGAEEPAAEEVTIEPVMEEVAAEPVEEEAAAEIVPEEVALLEPPAEAEAVEEVAAEEPQSAGDVLIEALGLSTRAANVLVDAGLETAQDLLDKLQEGDAEFLSIPGAGGKTLEEVEERLSEAGLLDLDDEEEEG
jgi:small subunit ribosomal protein S16